VAAFLTDKDVRQLLEDSSADSRAETAAKVAGAFSSNQLGSDERRLAEDIFRIMLKDAESRVREALSENLKTSPDIPHDVALSLAADVASVALPVLEFSVVLTDDDLLSIVRTQDDAKQMAIAGRPTVSSAVSDALATVGSEATVARLVGNENADLSDKALNNVIDRFGESESVQRPLVNRSALPVQIAERLVTMVSAELQNQLIRKQGDRSDLATRLLLKARERATVGLSMSSSEEQVSELIAALRKEGRLTDSLVIRAVCMGDLIFFEHALSAMSGVALENARQLIHDQGRLGLKALYQKSGMPQAQYTAVRAAIDVMRETEYDGLDHDRERFSRRLIERILTQYDDLGVDLKSDDLDYLLTRMDQLSPQETA
tara:strand:- start:108747 stop:109871 length:1125 start_codon:yes stop_codon:yes gene_type:complete